MFKVIVFIVALLALTGCISLPQTEALRASRYAGLPLRVELVDVSYYRQEDLMCGPTSLAYQLAPELRAVLQEVAAGTPVVVLLNIGGIKFWPVWHYAVVVGYDLEREEIILRSGLNPRRVTDVGFFEFLWKDGGYWAMAAVSPNRVPATAQEQPYAAAVAALELVRRREAGKAYRALLSRWPENLVGLIGLGNTEHAEGNLTGAEAAFRRAVAVHPQSAVAFNNLAQTLADLGRLEEAEAAARNAVAIGGATLPAAQSTLAQIIQSRSKVISTDITRDRVK